MVGAQRDLQKFPECFHKILTWKVLCFLLKAWGGFLAIIWKTITFHWCRTSVTSTSNLFSVLIGFPNEAVIDAYLFPTVNESKEGFSWAPPDLDRIREYMKMKFGWKTARIDEILLPVMKRQTERNVSFVLIFLFSYPISSSPPFFFSFCTLFFYRIVVLFGDF